MSVPRRLEARRKGWCLHSYTELAAQLSCELKKKENNTAKHFATHYKTVQYEVQFDAAGQQH